jgi:hypothetical protein
MLSAAAVVTVVVTDPLQAPLLIGIVATQALPAVVNPPETFRTECFPRALSEIREYFGKITLTTIGCPHHIHFSIIICPTSPKSYGKT